MVSDLSLKFVKREHLNYPSEVENKLKDFLILILILSWNFNPKYFFDCEEKEDSKKESKKFTAPDCLAIEFSNKLDHLI